MANHIHNFPDPHFTCQICHDTGIQKWLGEYGVCGCVKDEPTREIRKAECKELNDHLRMLQERITKGKAMMKLRRRKQVDIHPNSMLTSDHETAESAKVGSSGSGSARMDSSKSGDSQENGGSV